MKNNYATISSEDTINTYLKEIKKTNGLTPNEEVELAKKIQDGDSKAIDKLVSSNLKFVVSIAKDYQGQGLLFSDLISEGNYGLIKAAQKFDHTKGFKFISYAVYWIRQSIIESLNFNARTIRLPVNVILKENLNKKRIQKFESINKRFPTHGEVLEDGEVYEELILPSCTSINNFIGEDDDEALEYLFDKSIDEDLSKLDNDKLSNVLEKTLSLLQPREREIIEMYYGLNSYPESMDLEDIGNKFGLSKERVRQINISTIKKLRLNSSELYNFLKNN